MGIVKKIKKNKIYKLLEGNVMYRRGLYVFIFTMLVAALLVGSLIPDVVDLEVGDVSPVTIEADRYISFVDEEATALKKAAIEADVRTIYRLDRSILQDYSEELDNLSEKIKQVIFDDGLLVNQKVNILNGLGFNLTLADVEILQGISESQFDALTERLKVIVRSNFITGVNNESLLFVLEKINSDINLLDISSTYKKLMQNLVSSVDMVPNLIPDEEATQKELSERIEQVEPVRIVVQRNERVVSKGDVLTPKQIEIINWLGYSDQVNRFAIIASVILYTLIFIVLVSLFLRNYRKALYEEDRNIILLMVLFFLALLFTRIFISIQAFSVSVYAPLVSLLIPTAAISMLVAILLDDKLGYISAAIISIYIGLLTGQMVYMFMAFVGSFVGVYLVAQINQRGDLMKAGLFVSLANCIAIIPWLLTINEDISFYFVALAFGAINGIAATILAIGILPYFEDLFNKTTIIKLLELFNPNHPLLKKMILEAPGTYHHSLMLGNLAEGAAEAIGANSVLVRIGAIYHDIGKLKRPFFYVENQAGENPHEKLNPSLSVIVLQAHVKEGLELGRKYKLPKAILDFIPMHHGTSLINYFYHKAKETNPDVREEDFRYEGPKPDSKETAILMMADSVEAAVKSIKEPNQIKIENMVRNVIKDKLYDGQLDESELTMRDMEIIIKTFVKVLQGVYHTRIEYPEGVLKEIKKNKQQEGSHNDKD